MGVSSQAFLAGQEGVMYELLSARIRKVVGDLGSMKFGLGTILLFQRCGDSSM